MIVPAVPLDQTKPAAKDMTSRECVIISGERHRAIKTFTTVPAVRAVKHQRGYCLSDKWCETSFAQNSRLCLALVVGGEQKDSEGSWS